MREFSIGSTIKNIMQMKKDEMKIKLTEKADTVEILKESGYGQIKTRTTEDLRLSLINACVYEHLNM